MPSKHPGWTSHFRPSCFRRYKEGLEHVTRSVQKPGLPLTLLAQPDCYSITMATKEPRGPERKELEEGSFKVSEILNSGMWISSQTLRCLNLWPAPPTKLYHWSP